MDLFCLEMRTDVELIYRWGMQRVWENCGFEIMKSYLNVGKVMKISDDQM